MTYLVLHFKLFELRKFFLSTFLEEKYYTISNTSDKKIILLSLANIHSKFRLNFKNLKSKIKLIKSYGLMDFHFYKN